MQGPIDITEEMIEQYKPHNIWKGPELYCLMQDQLEVQEEILKLLEKQASINKQIENWENEYIKK